MQRALTFHQYCRAAEPLAVRETLNLVGTPILLRFDVFGRTVGVARKDGEWRAVFIGHEGKHRDAPAITIPAGLPESELALFLGDLFHESASAERPDVIELSTAGSADVDPGSRRVIFLLGASGVGKTAVARYLEGREPWTDRVHYFDSIGVPPMTRMLEEYGSAEAWQQWATSQWVDRLLRKREALQLLEGQTRPSFVNQALEAAAPGIDPVVVLLNCSAEVRRRRLEGRGQPELANARMEAWSAYLSGQADALGLPVIETDEREVHEVAELVETVGLRGLPKGSL